MQNATSVSHVGVKEPTDAVYPWIVKNARRLDISKLSEVADLYTAEIDAQHEPRDGRYPLTYEQMSVSLNSLVEVLGRPLMAWAFLLPPEPKEYSVAYVRPYMATYLASRAHINDHFAFFGGAISDNANSPAARQFLKYQRFLARFSRYLQDPELKWMLDASERLQVDAPRPLFWKRTVYHKPLPQGGERIVLNILNLPSNGNILGQTEIPEPVQNVTLRIPGEFQPERVVFLDADNPSLTPLALESIATTSEGTEYRLPPVTSWAMVVIETKPPQKGDAIQSVGESK